MKIWNRFTQSVRRALPAKLLFLLCASALADPVLLRDINPGQTDSLLSNYYSTGDLYFFRAYQTPHGSEVWRTDGTPAGTFMVQDLRPGFNESANPYAFTPLSDVIMFGASDGVTPGLFVTRGLANDIVRIKEDFTIWQNAAAPLGDELLCSGSEIGPLGGDRELWKVTKITDTLFNTERLKDINEGSLASFPEDLLNIEDRVYFRADDGDGEALWQSYGTGASTTLVLAPPTDLRLQFPEGLTNVAGRLFTAASTNEHGNELWVVEPGNARVMDICSGTCGAGAGGIAAVGSLAYFRSLGDFVTDGSTGAELWRSDGTMPGTWKVKEIGPGNRPGYISTITDFDGTSFYFLADDEVHGLELWRSDGTEDGTYMVKDINPGPASGVSNVQTQIAVARGRVYFAADNGRNGFELWRSDGTERGTYMLKNMNTAGDGYPSNFAVIGDYLVFTATDVAHGAEIWALELPLFADDFEGAAAGPGPIR